MKKSKYDRLIKKTPTEPVEVSVRIRQLDDENQPKCVRVVDGNVLQLIGPPNDTRSGDFKFSDIYSEAVNQKILFENVASPMVEDLIDGKNGLLFTYGVTNSGKTYTMTGTVEEPGFLPRCLDMIFNSLGEAQAPKYTFIRDNVNGFEVNNNSSKYHISKDLLDNIVKTPKARRNASRYDLEYRQSKNVKKDYKYAIFMSYIEIYNDFVYDLLGEVLPNQYGRYKNPPALRLREDRDRCVYVSECSEVEIKTTEDAFVLLQHGQERKKIASNQLNSESSRSHSILTIRLVQAPLDPMGEEILPEKSLINVSQLSLVDLAGSERSSRTGTYRGKRLQESGNINCSLMTLRRCLEQLRYNQQNQTNEHVKYRNSKLTHLFKRFFEGYGKVKMVVCINPCLDEFEENLHVMQFSEVASLVEVKKADKYNVDKETIKKKLQAIQELKRKNESENNRKHKTNRALKKRTALKIYPSLSLDTCSSKASVSSDVSPLPSNPSNALFVNQNSNNFTVFDDFPSTDLLSCDDGKTILNLISYLKCKVKSYKKNFSKADKIGKLFQTNLNMLVKNQRQLDSELKEKIIELTKSNKNVEKFERQIRKLESKNQVLTKTTKVFESENKTLLDQVSEAHLKIKSSETDIRRIETKINGAVASTRAKIEKVCKKRVQDARISAQEQIWAKNEQLRQLMNIVPPKSSCKGDSGEKYFRAGVNQSASHISTHSSVHKQSCTFVPQATPRTPIPTPRSTRPFTCYSANSKINSNKSGRSYTSRSSKSNLSKNRVGDDGQITNTNSKFSIKSRRSHSAEPSSRAVEVPKLDIEKSCENSNTRKNRSLKKTGKTKIQNGCPPVVNHKNSANKTGNWLNHLPNTTVPIDTIFQPSIAKQKRVSNPAPKDIALSDKYVLTHQHETNAGEIETQLYKGQVVQTRTGGHQVQFVDIETLGQEDPKNFNFSYHNDAGDGNRRQKRSSSAVDSEQSSWTDVETRCAFGISSITAHVMDHQNPPKSKRSKN